MTSRRGLIYSGGFISEASDQDVIPIVGDLIAGSGLGNRLFSLGQNDFVQIFVSAQSSGLIYTPDGTLSLDGYKSF